MVASILHRMTVRHRFTISRNCRRQPIFLLTARTTGVQRSAIAQWECEGRSLPEGILPVARPQGETTSPLYSTSPFPFLRGRGI